MKTVFSLLRVKQWVKNLFVFVPLIFSGLLLSAPGLLKGLAAFFCFCFVASSIYIFNDIADRDTDRLHPVKRHRPIASGRVPAEAARIVSALLFLLSATATWFLFPDRPLALLIITGYAFINILYTVWLKHIPIVDVMIIAFGFVLRVLFGGVTTGIPVTPWLVLMVFLLTLLIAFGKRRDDLIRLRDQGVEGRRSVAQYNLRYIDQVLALLSATVIVAYVCYTLTEGVEERFHSGYVYLTSVFVIAAILRYLQIATVMEKSGKPTNIVYSDRFLQVCGVLWLISFMFIIYF